MELNTELSGELLEAGEGMGRSDRGEEPEQSQSIHLPQTGPASLLVLTFGDFLGGTCHPVVPVSRALGLLPLGLLAVN